MEKIPALAQVEELLEQPLYTDNGVQLAAQLVEIEAWGSRVAFLLYSSKQELDRKKRLALLPKSKEYTDVDRITRQEADCAEYQAKTDYLAQIQELIKRRISLGQTILKAMRTEMETRVGNV